MTKIKSFSVGDGDMFYIKHAGDSFTIIDCCLPNDNQKRKENIIQNIKHAHSLKRITRFISTHPDQDHMRGLKELDDNIDILNFYCVKNEATREDESEDFQHYCSLRDDQKKAFYLYKGCMRKWINQSCEERNHAGIHILWPILNNKFFKEALLQANAEESPNNISPIIQYSLKDGATFLWMGDLETDFMENIVDDISFSKVNILFAPHHGRESGKVPNKWLEQINPDVVIIGEALSENLDYAGYNNYNKITQNSAEDIILDCIENKIHIYVSNENYSVDFLDNEYMEDEYDCFYLGTLNLE